MELSEIVSVSMTDRFNLDVGTTSDDLIKRVISPETGTIHIHVKTHAENVRCFTVDAAKHIYVLGNKERDENSTLKHYSRGVRITLNKDQKTCVKYPDNNVRVISFTPEGKVQLWTVAIVSQGTKFFLVTQANGEFQFYRQYDDAVNRAVAVCPDIERWDSLVQFVNDLLDPEKLPEFRDEYSPTAKKNGKPELTGNEGYVQWFSDPENMGVIQTADGPARVHWSTIERPDSRRAFLKTGEKVTFTKLISPNNTRAGRNSSFKYEAVGVTVVEAKQ